MKNRSELAILIIAKNNYETTEWQKQRIQEIVNEFYDELPSQLAFKILSYLKLPLLENSLNLTNLITEFKRKKRENESA